MTFATPWLFGAAVAASVMVGLLHLLSVRRPPVLSLPTARFVVDGDARAVARRPRPNDLLLLLMRVLAVLAAGAALAGIQFDTGRARAVRLVMVDSAAATDSSWRAQQLRLVAAADSLAMQNAGAVEHLVFTVAGLARDPARALVRARQHAAALVAERPELERVALTVVVPDSVDTVEGWKAWRTRWPGAITVQRANPVRDAGGVPANVSGSANPANEINEAATVAMASRFGRGTMDSRITIVWPQDGAPDGWLARAAPDTVSAVVSRGRALVGPFVRVVRAPATDGATPYRVIAWWSDGSPAAIEEQAAGRCVRTIAIRVPPASDLLLSAPAEGLLQSLRAPCVLHSVSTAALRVPNAGRDAGRDAAASAFRAGESVQAGTRPTWLGSLLLLLALVLLGGEWLVRRGESL